jgi:hypothetical protein
VQGVALLCQQRGALKQRDKRRKKTCSNALNCRQHSICGMTTDKATLQAILTDLADVDSHVEPIAVRTPADSDLNILAYAVHHLVEDLRDLINALD